MSADKTRYFDVHHVEIGKNKFNRLLSTNKYLEIQGDSAAIKKLVERENRGKINDRALLESLLEKQIREELDSAKPIVIIFYPGKDPCNSSGSASIQSRIGWYKELDKGVQQIAQVKPIYIYKDKDGLEKYEGLLTWNKDPQGAIERLFFLYHYPCSSFVVISKEGNYISYFGEFPKEYVWEATQVLNN